jgi:uncharacterized protein
MIDERPPHRVPFPVMYQTWSHITFFHWYCKPELLQVRLPERVQIDTFDGNAWVGLTPFLLENLRPPFLPALPWLSQFPETNLRTYVRGPSGPGIWFFSLDADRLIAAIGGRIGFGLPYYWADMRVTLRGDEIEYYSSRGGRATTRIRAAIGPKIDEPEELAKFLTARFRLYAVYRNSLLTVPVEHRPWPLRLARSLEFSETLRSAAGVSAGEAADFVIYSTGVDVRIGAPAFI